MPLFPTLVLAAAIAQDEAAVLPKVTFTADQVWTIISPDLGTTKRNQPVVVDGRLLLGGNGDFDLYDIHDPFAPALVSSFASDHRRGEAESHQLSVGRTRDGRTLVATISGIGVDLWDLTDPETPKLLADIVLEGIDYGDNTEAVWGVALQGDTLFAGGTNTGLHVVDVSDPTDPEVVTRLPVSELGGVSAGPLWVLGDLLVITTPKNHRGVATVDVSDPFDPALLDAVVPDDLNSYIGGFYGGDAWLITPLRRYDVTTDPSAIQLVSSTPTVPSEYLSFGDGRLFNGALRPLPGIDVYDITGEAPEHVGKLGGRLDGPALGNLTDDQFSFPVGNLLVMCDDEVRYGCVIGVHQAAADDQPPEAMQVRPRDGATGVAPTAAIGVSFSDQIDLRSVDTTSWVVRPLGGDPIDGSWGHNHTVVTFDPASALDPDTTYEVVLAKGGIADLSGNALRDEVRWTFATGDELTRLGCKVGQLPPVRVGSDATLEAADDEGATRWRWDLGDGRTADGQAASARWDAPGRYAVTLTVGTDDARRTCSGTQTVHAPILPTAPTHASTVATTPTHAWVVNEDADTVARIDLADGTLLEVRVGDDPRTVAIDGEGRVWVANAGSDDVTVLDGDGELVGVVPLRWGGRPYGVAITPDGTRAWVSLEGSGELVAIDTATLEVIWPFDLSDPDDPFPVHPRGVAVHPDGERVLVTRFLSPADHGELMILVGDTVQRIPLAIDTTPDDHDAGRGVPNQLSHVAISPDGLRASLPAVKDNVQRGGALDGEPLDSDNTVRTIVMQVAIDGDAREDTDVRSDLDDHDSAFASVYAPLGDLVFVASQGTNQVDVLDAHTGDLVGGFSTGLAPQGLALVGDGRLVVHDMASRTLSVFDVSGFLDGDDPRAVRQGQWPTLSEEPLPPAILLGKQLYHNADSAQMSQDGYLSCATCHVDGGGDARVWDFTDRGEGLRNTIDLRGKAGTRHGPVHWTANFDEIQDFEHDIRFAFGGSGLMANDDFLADGHDDALGTPKAGVSERLDALAAYVTTFDTFPRSPYRNPDGTLTVEAEWGGRIFDTLDCTTCHSGAILTDSPSGQRHDVGTLSDKSGQRRGEALDGLDTPTLLGLHATAPYLHDGSAATIQEVLSNPEHGDAAGLSDAQKDWVAAYLLSLENEQIEVPPGCVGCQTGPRPPLGWLLVGAVVALRRRQRAVDA